MKRIRTLALHGAAHIRLVLLPAIWLSLFAYAGRPLLVAAQAGGFPRSVAWGGLFVLSLLPLLPFLLRRSHWIGYATLAVFSSLLVLVVLGDVLRVVYFLVDRSLNARAVSLGIAATAGFLSLVGLFQARCPKVKRVTVPIDELPDALDGYRIVQWSDVHVGPTIRRRFLQSLVEKTNALDADAIAITGDFVDGPVDELRDEVTPLRDLRTRDGVFYVTGNHEYYWGAPQWCLELESHGLTFLRNEHRVVQRGGARIAFAGVTDPVGRHAHKQDPDAALAGTPGDAIKVLLSHRPQTAEHADRLGAHLQLSGHTHGGQFFPFNLVIKWFQPIVAGLHRVGRTWLYVSRGTGYWGPPSRLGVRGEITVIELRRSERRARSASS